MSTLNLVHVGLSEKKYLRAHRSLFVRHMCCETNVLLQSSTPTPHDLICLKWCTYKNHSYRVHNMILYILLYTHLCRFHLHYCTLTFLTLNMYDYIVVCNLFQSTLVHTLQIYPLRKIIWWNILLKHNVDLYVHYYNVFGEYRRHIYINVLLFTFSIQRHIKHRTILPYFRD